MPRLWHMPALRRTLRGPTLTPTDPSPQDRFIRSRSAATTMQPRKKWTTSWATLPRSSALESVSLEIRYDRVGPPRGRRPPRRPRCCGRVGVLRAMASIPASAACGSILDHAIARRVPSASCRGAPSGSFSTTWSTVMLPPALSAKEAAALTASASRSEPSTAKTILWNIGPPHPLVLHHRFSWAPTGSRRALRMSRSTSHRAPYATPGEMGDVDGQRHRSIARPQVSMSDSRSASLRSSASSVMSRP